MQRIRKISVFVVVAAFCFWIIYSSFPPTFPKVSEEAYLYSNQSRQNLRTIYAKAIADAKESIHLVIFGLNDLGILDVLSRRAHEGIPTTIYFDAKESPLVPNRIPKADLHPMLLGGLMHQKILIIDHDLVLIGSANLTPSSLRMHDNLVVGIRSPILADFLFKKIPLESGYIQTVIGDQTVELWLLPDPSGQALSDLCRHIQKATRSIKIALFTFTHPMLCEELIAASKRGVDVTVVIDMHSGLGASKKAVDLLSKHPIKILLSQGIQLLHHKFVWIDQETLICGSANWTKAAFEKNSDCMLALHHLTASQKKFMKVLWHRIETEAKNPNY